MSNLVDSTAENGGNMTFVFSLVSLTFNYALAKVYKNGRIWIIRMHILFLCDTLHDWCCFALCCSAVVYVDQKSLLLATLFLGRSSLIGTHISWATMFGFYTPCVYTTRTTSIVFECGLFFYLLPSNFLLALSECSTVEGK